MEEAQGTDHKSHENSATMVERDVQNNRIVVSLWTIQVVTVLFVVVSMSIWVALVTGMPLNNTVLGGLGVFFLAVLMTALFAEFRLYVRHVLSIEIYLRLQVAKAISWAMVLILLESSFGAEGAGIKVFTEAAKKLM
jgi:hypothetical protein